MYPEQHLIASCEQTVATLTATMTSHGYRIERSFDLRSALQSKTDCPCPHHGTSHCTCQYVVLLAYEPAIVAAPAVITVHECDGLTRVRVAAGQPGDRPDWIMLATLDEALTSVTADV